MDCPACHALLSTMESMGTLIDYCPQCKGLWFENGKSDFEIYKYLLLGGHYELPHMPGSTANGRETRNANRLLSAMPGDVARKREAG